MVKTICFTLITIAMICFFRERTASGDMNKLKRHAVFKFEDCKFYLFTK